MFIGLAMRWSETTIVLFVYLFMSISRRSRHVVGVFPVYDMCTAEIWNIIKGCMFDNVVVFIVAITKQVCQ